MPVFTVTGVKPGSTTLTVTSTADTTVKATIPVTVTPAAAENLIQYGPAGNLHSGDSATVNEDGTLKINGTVKQGNNWDGIKWACDISKFTPGTTITISADGLPATLETFIRFDDNNDAAHTLIYPAREGYASTGVVPAGAKTVLMAIRRKGVTSDFNAARVAVMVNEGETALPWVRPDVTNVGGGMI